MHTILVANRGEIARRVFRTCREMGLGTVAVFSDADADMPFVREADAAVRLPGSAPAETYLRGDLILDVGVVDDQPLVAEVVGLAVHEVALAHRACGLTGIDREVRREGM